MLNNGNQIYAVNWNVDDEDAHAHISVNINFTGVYTGDLWSINEEIDVHSRVLKSAESKRLDFSTCLTASKHSNSHLIMCSWLSLLYF